MPTITQLKTRKTFLQRLRNYFLTGIVVAAPIAITVYLTWLFITFIDDLVTPLIPERYNPETYLPFGLPGLGLIIVISVLTLLGALAANFAGRALLSIGDSIFDRMPVVRSIYSVLKQIFETVISTSSSSFKDVVLLEYPGPGLWSIGFITNETKNEVQDLTEDDVVNVFIPMGLNPTAGFLVLISKKKLTKLNMSVDEGLKHVISAGLVVAPSKTTPDTPAPVNPPAA